MNRIKRNTYGKSYTPKIGGEKFTKYFRRK